MPIQNNKVVTEVDIDFQGGEQTVGEIRQSFKDATQEIGNTVKGTTEYYTALKKLADAKGDIVELRRAIKDANPADLAKNIGGVVKGIAGGYAAAVGAVALFSDGNEKLEKELVKVQGAIALLHGLQELSEGYRKAQALTGTLILATNANSAALTTEAGAAGAATTSTVALGTALTTEAGAASVATTSTVTFGTALKIATGAAIIAGIIALANYWDDLAKAVKGAYDPTEELNKATKSFIESAVKEQLTVRDLITEYENHNTGLSRKKDILFDLNQKAPEYFKNLNTEKESIQDLEKAYTNYSEALLIQAQLRGAQDLLTKKSAALIELETSSVNGQLSTWDKAALLSQGLFNDAEARAKLANVNVVELTKKTKEETEPVLKLIETLKEQLRALNADTKTDVHTKRIDTEDKAGEEKLKKQQENLDAFRKLTASADEIELTENEKKLKALDDAATKATTKSLADINEYENARELIIAAIQQDNDKKRLARQEFIAKDNEAARKKESDAILKANQVSLQAEQTALEKQLENGQITKEQFDVKTLQLKINSDKLLLNTDLLSAKDRLDVQKDFNAESLKLAKLKATQAVDVVKNDEAQKKKQADDGYAAANKSANDFFKSVGLNLNADSVLRANKAVSDKKITLDSLNSQLKIAQDNGQSTVDIQSKIATAEKDISKDKTQAQIEDLGFIGDALSAFAELAGKNTQAGKDLSIAASIIKTIEGAIAAFTGTISQIPGPVGVALGFVESAAVLAAGFANVRKIASTPIPGQAGSSASIPGGGGSYTPPSIGASQSVTNLSGNSIDAINAQSQNPIKVFVTESDISTAQGNVRGYSTQGSISGG